MMPIVLRTRGPVVALASVALLLAGLIFPAAAPVVCVGEDHRAVEALLDGCCPVPAPPREGGAIEPGCGACVDLVAASALAGGNAPVLAGALSAPTKPAVSPAPPAAETATEVRAPALALLSTVVLRS